MINRLPLDMVNEIKSFLFTEKSLKRKVEDFERRLRTRNDYRDHRGEPLSLLARQTATYRLPWQRDRPDQDYLDRLKSYHSRGRMHHEMFREKNYFDDKKKGRVFLARNLRKAKSYPEMFGRYGVIQLRNRVKLIPERTEYDT